MGALSSLASTLGYSEELLEEIALGSANHYRPFHIVSEKKVDGKVVKKVRHIDNPAKELPLRKLQQSIRKNVLNPNSGLLTSSLVGGITKRNIGMYLSPHLGKETIVCMDLKNCFPNINSKRVYKIWTEQLGFSKEEARILTYATTYRGYLPQGSPTSSMICNFALNPMAKKIKDLLVINDVDYTQYIDDICFSGSDIVVRRMIGEIIPIINSYGQKVNKKKNVIMDSKKRQLAMGIIVNSKTRVNQKYVDDIVAAIKAISSEQAIPSTTYLSLTGKILYVSKVDKMEGTRLIRMLDTTINRIYDDDNQKTMRGIMKPCRMYYYDRTGLMKCKHLSR